MEKKRCGWLDVMKLLCIYGVYALHYPAAGRVGLFFSSFVVGALFFASGCAVSLQKDEPLLLFMKKRFLRLMVPYFVFGIGTLLVRVLLLEMSLGEIIGWMRGLLLARRDTVPVATLWFLPCLFWMAAGYQLLRKKIRSRGGLLAVCLAISVFVKMVHEGPLLPWGIEQAGRYLIYYALGDFVFDAIQTWKKHPAPLWAKALLAVFVLGNAFVCYTNFYFGSMYFPSLVGVTALPYPALALLAFVFQCNGIVCVLALAMLLQGFPGLCRAGRYTMVFCGAESLVKTLVPLACEAVGLVNNWSDGSHTLVHAALMLAVAYYALARPLEAHAPWVLGRIAADEKKIKTAV